MIRQDGTFEIYRLQHRWKNDPQQEWIHTSANEHIFGASEECWQKTGVHGTFDKETALKGLRKTRQAVVLDNLEYRLVRVILSRKTEPIEV